MTGSDGQEPPKGAASVGPERLELRARPHPVTRINRKVVIGGAAVLLFLISCIVLVALKPPSFRVSAPGALQCRPQAHHRCALEASRNLRRRQEGRHREAAAGRLARSARRAGAEGDGRRWPR